MSVYIRFTRKSRGLNAVKELVDYVYDSNKTQDRLCHTLGVCKQSVADDMIFVKRLFCQTDKRQMLHWVLSFDAGVETETADMIGQEVLHMLSGEYQAICATHTNTLNRHVHFAINTVNVKTGKKFTNSKKDMLYFRNEINRVLEKYDLSPIGGAVKMEEEEWEIQEHSVDICFSDHDVDNGYHEIVCDTPQYCIETKCLSCDSDVSQRYGQNATLIYTVYKEEYGHIWKGKGAIENGIYYSPAVYYGKTIEGPFTVRQTEEDHTFVGHGVVEDGKVLIPGVLKEEIK